MSCQYKDKGPSYSGWCDGPKQDFSKCVEFLVTAYENEKKRMTPNEYQKLAMRTCSIPYDQKQDMLMHAVLGLTSEAGEVSGLFQKKYQGHKLDPEHLEKELGDCLWMIAEACAALGWNMETVMQTNIEKLRARYPGALWKTPPLSTTAAPACLMAMERLSENRPLEKVASTW